MISIADNLQNVRQLIKNAAISAGRDENSVQLLAVSKTHPATAIRAAIDAGQRRFGENYLQEALDKILTLRDITNIEWHFIGPIQSNKTRPIAENFHWVHTLDREKTAHRLDAQRPSTLAPLNVCIQINIDNEPTKSGIMPTDLAPLAAAITKMPNLQLRGLMAIPKAQASDAEMAASFTKMQRLFEKLKTQHPSVDTLSMGMSADLNEAIAAGSTMVRIGTAIFGARADAKKD
ncbi:MAG: YggS family pyridoxal phosphate-dependent enzyme [Hahellaceae bacterium]|nr:YggS family pyridoxal phosphate-dependent enzyme [Hahellaceae bacterium]MCP5209649.1 YggS family pyridoxal phosphate-dependent enzyme [Hahellaceae bacterium]